MSSNSLFLSEQQSKTQIYSLYCHTQLQLKFTLITSHLSFPDSCETLFFFFPIIFLTITIKNSISVRHFLLSKADPADHLASNPTVKFKEQRTGEGLPRQPRSVKVFTAISVSATQKEHRMQGGQLLQVFSAFEVLTHLLFTHSHSGASP